MTWHYHLLQAPRDPATNYLQGVNKEHAENPWHIFLQLFRKKDNILLIDPFWEKFGAGMSYQPSI